MKPVKIILATDLILLNIGLGFIIYKTQIQNPNPQITKTSSEVSANPILFPQPTGEVTDTCGPECRKYIDVKIASMAAAQPVIVVPTAKPLVITKTAPKVKTRTVSYVTIPGNGSVTENDWQDISGTDFYFDTSDYPGLTEIYFEANLKLFNGNGMAYVRLFDVTHGIGVQGSEVSTNSQIDSLITSGQVTFWAGKNLIRVQAKSLTADTTIFNYGRLKVITEN
jgi:hypothetical protein